jgi:hypothetical protein
MVNLRRRSLTKEDLIINNCNIVIDEKIIINTKIKAIDVKTYCSLF